jgi:hypothetical protein
VVRYDAPARDRCDFDAAVADDTSENGVLDVLTSYCAARCRSTDRNRLYVETVRQEVNK